MSSNENSFCGTCEHFGNDIPEDKLVQIRINPQAELRSIAACDLPNNASLHLRVSAVSTCDAYSPAA